VKHNEHPLILFTAFGFFFLWIDVCLGHLGADHFELYMLIPLVFLPCAMVMAIGAAFWATPLNQNLYRYVCMLAVIVGIFGCFFHLLQFQQQLVGPIQWEVFVRKMRYPPLIAPFAISGIGILGLIINYKKP